MNIQQKPSHPAWAQLLLRIAVSLTLFSAVADRLGYWGQQSVWGNWANFEAYTGQLLFFLPKSIVAIAAITATILEIVLGILLLLGYKTKQVAFLTGCLLVVFGISMVIALGVKSTLDYSIWISAFSCFLLAANNQYPFSIDHLNKRKWKKE